MKLDIVVWFMASLLGCSEGIHAIQGVRDQYRTKRQDIAATRCILSGLNEARDDVPHNDKPSDALDIRIRTLDRIVCQGLRLRRSCGILFFARFIKDINRRGGLSGGMLMCYLGMGSVS